MRMINMSITLKRWDESGNNCLGTQEITLDQLEYIWHSLRAADPDFRAPVIEDKIYKLLQANLYE
jgi:hypothetical protein